MQPYFVHRYCDRSGADDLSIDCGRAYCGHDLRHVPAATERAERSPVYYAGRLTIMQRLVRFSDHLTAGNAAADTPSVHISAAFE